MMLMDMNRCGRQEWTRRFTRERAARDRAASKAMIAAVRRVLYDPDTGVGVVELIGVSATDMRGCVRYFTERYASVRRIIVINEWGVDNAYVRQEDGWISLDLRRRGE